MVNHHPAKFGGSRHCGSGDMMLLAIEGQDFTWPRLNPQLSFISKAHGMACFHTKTFST